MAGSAYIIRNYSPDDFDKYLQLCVESEQLDPSGRFISAQGLSDNLGRPNVAPETDIFVAELSGKLVGCLNITLEPGIQRALFDGLVHPLYRRKGIATEQGVPSYMVFSDKTLHEMAETRPSTLQEMGSISGTPATLGADCGSRSSRGRRWILACSGY